jgi:hypothetical protein
VIKSKEFDGRGMWHVWEDFGRGYLMEREHFEDLGLDGRIILKMFFKNLDGGVDWIAVAQDMERWRAIVNAILKFRVP